MPIDRSSYILKHYKCNEIIGNLHKAKQISSILNAGFEYMKIH